MYHNLPIRGSYLDGDCILVGGVWKQLQQHTQHYADCDNSYNKNTEN